MVSLGYEEGAGTLKETIGRTAGCLLITMLLSVPLLLMFSPGEVSAADDVSIPSRFDLRDYDGKNFVSAVKSQSGGTCWTHGTMAAIESNLMVTGLWNLIEGNNSEPNLAEYHLDWWNGFNNYTNYDRDPPGDSGLWVHYGGDYLVASAYLSRGDGAVRDKDGQFFDDPPALRQSNYHRYYPAEIEWYQMDDELNGIDDIKRAIMDYGAVATCMNADPNLRDSTHAHYQPPSDNRDPNHSVTIVGWDDTKTTPAPLNGAWLVKNSWGSEWGNQGYFWISYYDKWACKHPEMGAVSFKNVSYLSFDRAYYYDYHGWRDTWTRSTEAFNLYTAERNEQLKGVNFYTTEESVSARVEIWNDFEDGELSNLLWTDTEFYQRKGLHTIFFEEPLELLEGNDFCILLNVSQGGIAYDRTSLVPTLLDPPTREPGPDSWVTSFSAPNQSYFHNGTKWSDLYFSNESSNFCINGLVGHVSISSPMTHDMVGSSYTFLGPASNEIDQVKVRIDNGTPMTTIIRNGIWRVEMNDLHLVSGPHRLTATGTQDGCESVVSTTWVEFIFDDNDPVTTVNLSGERGFDGWFLSDVNVTLQGEDMTSSISMTEFAIDQGDWGEYTGPFIISDDGVHQISFRSQDIAGNLEQARRIEVKIDKEAPGTEAFVLGDMGSEEWYISNVELRFTSQDGTSGLKEVRLEIDGEPLVYDPADPPVIDMNGDHSFSYHAIDKAGNLEEMRNESFKIDLEGPSTEMVVHGTEGNLGWYLSPVQVELMIEEGYSGIESTQYRIVGGRWEEYKVPLNMESNGLFTLEFFSKDLAGNKEPVKTGYVKIDTNTPETSLDIEGEEGEAGIYISPVSLSLSGSDKTSGYSGSYYQLDESDPILYTEPITIDTNGIHEIIYYSVDRAGNAETPKMEVLTLDIDDPLVDLEENLQGAVFNSTNMTLHVRVYDEGLPGGLSFRLDQGADTVIEDNITVLKDLKEGKHVLEIVYTAVSGRMANATYSFMINYSFGKIVANDDDDTGTDNDKDGLSLIIWIIVIVVIVILLASAAVVVFLVVRRSGPSKEQEAGEGPEVTDEQPEP